jgi:ABC-2 type transport system ATP-binding protein
MSEFAVDIQTLRKRYNNGVEALGGVSLQVPYGSIFGLIGPNGAGKSTLVKSLLTILRPTECRGTMLGETIGHKATLAKVGYLPEHARFPEYLTGRQVIEYAAGLAHLSRAACRTRCDELLEKVGMSQAARRTIRTYSKGMKQRIGLAQALIHDPTVVFLDEPTDGVDPEGRIDFKNLIAAMRGEGRTVFVNSHLLAEVEQVADRVAILSKGRIIQQGLVSDLTRRDARYEIKFLGQLPPALMEWCRQQQMAIDGDRISCRADGPQAMQALIDKLRASFVIICEIKEERFSLEELFLQAVSQAREAAASGTIKKGGPA